MSRLAEALPPVADIIFVRALRGTARPLSLSPPDFGLSSDAPALRVFRDPQGTQPCAPGGVACIGAFDGLHLGHQALLARTVERARALQGPAIAISFEPLPREYFASGARPPRLLSPRGKLDGLCAAGIDAAGLLRFDAGMARTSAEEFVQSVVVETLAVREVWVGPEFHFGHGRRGDLGTLQQEGRKHGFDAHAIQPVMLDGERVSSSRIREALAAGDFAAVQRLLGRAYAIGGRVIRGRQLGRTLGYPTANLHFHDRTPPFGGIFAARVHGVGPLARPAVASIGVRPTLGGTEPLLEAHLFDFDGDLYGRRIEVEPVAMLREELKFPDLPSLVAQMDRDAAAARSILDACPVKACA